MQEVTKLIITLPFNYPENTVRRIGRALIEVIQERTSSGLDKHGNAFTTYSDSYRKSLVFKQARKTGRVNLRLTNRMLSSLKVIEVSTNYVVIGITEQEQVEKAYNHIIGDTLPQRDFLGVSPQELNKVLLNFPAAKEAELFEAWAEQQITDLKISQEKAEVSGREAITLEELEKIKARLYQEVDEENFISVSSLYKVLRTKQRINMFLSSANNFRQFFREIPAENKKGFLTFRSQRIKGIEIL